MKLIAFVILHYNTIDDTIECVSSIKDNIEVNKRQIIIVDNCSPNNSGAMLESLYCNDNEVHVILSNENLGFAKGNNIGFKFAKKKLGADYIVLMNNDTKILNPNFYQMVNDEFCNSHCAVIGPKVITPNPPYNSNPGPQKLPSKMYLFKQQTILYIYLLLSYIHLDEWCHKKFGRSEKKRKIMADKEPYSQRIENVQLHGCFWVFTPAYICKFDGINDKTFLYYEEQLLFARILKCGLKSVYLPSIEIYHKEDSATNSINYGSEVNKRRILYRRLIDSRWILIHELYS